MKIRITYPQIAVTSVIAVALVAWITLAHPFESMDDCSDRLYTGGYMRIDFGEKRIISSYCADRASDSEMKRHYNMGDASAEEIESMREFLREKAKIPGKDYQ